MMSRLLCAFLLDEAHLLKGKRGGAADAVWIPLVCEGMLGGRGVPGLAFRVWGTKWLPSLFAHLGLHGGRAETASGAAAHAGRLPKVARKLRPTVEERVCCAKCR